MAVFAGEPMSFFIVLFGFILVSSTIQGRAKGAGRIIPRARRERVGGVRLGGTAQDLLDARGQCVGVLRRNQRGRVADFGHSAYTRGDEGCAARHGFENGVGNELVLSRLDSKRDYIDVRDVASAFSALLDGNLQNAVYNIGRGKAVTNRELVEMLLREKKMPAELSIVETEQKAEPLVASCADISRIMEDTGWQPKYDLQNTIEEMTK